MNLREQRAAALKAAKDVVDRARAEARDLTPGEQATFDQKMTEVEDLDRQLKSAAESKERFDRLAAIHDPDAGFGDGRKGYLGLRGHQLASSIARKLGEAGGSKALITIGDQFADVPMLSTDPFAQGRPPTSLLDVIPTGRIDAPTFTFLRQTSRTNNAAVVQPGGLKPTSQYGLTPVDGKLRVVAHLSEALDSYMLSDSAGLLRFVQAELLFGLARAVENQILNGDGLSGNMTGLSATSGIQTVAYVPSDQLLTLRKGVTACQSLGYQPRVWVLSPQDWESIETTSTADGQYTLNGTNGSSNLPVDSAAQRIWGTPVVVTTAQAPGSGYLLADQSVELVTDARGEGDHLGSHRRRLGT